MSTIEYVKLGTLIFLFLYAMYIWGYYNGANYAMEKADKVIEEYKKLVDEVIDILNGKIKK